MEAFNVLVEQKGDLASKGSRARGLGEVGWDKSYLVTRVLGKTWLAL